MKTKALFGLALLVAMPAVAPAEDLPGPENYRVRLEGRWWMPSLNSQIQKGFGADRGTVLDLSDHLGVQDQNTWEARGVIRLTRSVKLVGSYVPLDYSGQQAAPFNFNYGDEFYFRGENVATTLKGSMYGGEIRWEFMRKRGGYLGVILGARVLMFDSVVLSAETGKRVIDSETLPVPVLGVTGRTYAGRRISVEGTLAGLSLGDRGHLYELDVAARLHISDRFAAAVGYRRLSLEGQDERDAVKMNIGGWTFGVELSL